MTSTITEGRPSRDELGNAVREIWIEWARQQDNPKPTWLVPYHELAEEDKEADRMIGEALFTYGVDWLTARLPHG